MEPATVCTGARWAVTLYRKKEVVPQQHGWRHLMGERCTALLAEHACFPEGCSLYHIGLQPVSHMQAASHAFAGCYA